MALFVRENSLFHGPPTVANQFPTSLLGMDAATPRFPQGHGRCHRVLELAYGRVAGPFRWLIIVHSTPMRDRPRWGGDACSGSEGREQAAET